jgi:hypothetical protein
MPKTIFDVATRNSLRARIATLRPDSPRKFGKMNPAQMMCHLEDSISCATGRTPTKAKKSAMSSRFLRWLIIYVIPWPKGKAETVPEMMLTQPGEFERDKQRLVSALDEAAQRGASTSWATHPAFGDLTGRDYGTLIYRHFDHHLKQFSV